MEIKQIYSLLNDCLQETYGTEAVDNLDVTDVMSVRETVFAEGYDRFLNVLVDRIGKTVIRTLKFTSNFPKFIMEDFEFGAILQKIDVQPLEAQSQEAWNIGEQAFTPNLYKIDKADVRVGFFRNASAWEVDITIPDTMFKTALTSAEQMGAFITAIFDSMSTSLNMQLETITRLQICTFIATKCEDGNGVVDLLARYNEVATTPIYSAEKAMCNKEFLRFAGKIMRNYITYMGRPSTLYNMGDGSGKDYVRSTPESDMHVLLLTEFAEACNTYLDSDTFHNSLVALPYYQEVAYWQGSGKSYPDFSSCSNINVTLDNDEEHSGASAVTVNQPGIVGLFCDREAIGVGLYDRFTAADRNNRNRYTNYTEGVTIQTFLDYTENGVIFVVVDQTEPEPGD